MSVFMVCSSAALAAPKIVVVDLTGKSREASRGTHAAAEQALQELSVETVSDEQTDTAASECTGNPSCFAALGKRAGASHMLEIHGGYLDESYSLHLEVRDVSTGRTVATDGKDCEICSANDFYRAVHDRTVTVWTRFQREQAAAASTPVPQPTPARKDLISPPETRSRRPLWRQPLPLAGAGLAAAGLASVVFGTYFVVNDRDYTDSTHTYYKPRGGLGWSLVGAGTAGLLSGAALLYWGRDDRRGSGLSLGPGTIAYHGRF